MNNDMMEENIRIQLNQQKQINLNLYFDKLILLVFEIQFWNMKSILDMYN